ncbi:unnamed protein product [Choristocarpus tenellus]
MGISIPGLDHFTDETLFTMCNQMILPAWIIMILAPKWKMRGTIVWTTVLFNSLAYALVFGSALAASKDGVGTIYADMGTYKGVVDLLGRAQFALPAWIHYLAFDMVVGNLLLEKNLVDPAGLHHLLMAPVLVLVLMAGPMGVLSYFLASKISHLICPVSNKME